MVWLYRSLYHWGGEGYFTRTNYYYLPSLRLEEEGGGQHPVSSPSQVEEFVLDDLKLY